MASSHRLLVAVPCRIDGMEDQINALLDTGAEWCVLSRDLVEALGYDTNSHPETYLHTRLGLIGGVLERRGVQFSSGLDESLEIEATWFVSSEWPGPTVLGWKGCLERLRFALDPGEELFYFGDLTG